MLARLVLVRWLDAADPDEMKTWYTEEEVDKFGGEEVLITSVGWVRSDTKLYLTIVGDHTPNGDGTFTYGRPTKIPHSMIQFIAELDVPPQPVV